jgi:ribosomal protein L15E
MSVERVMRKDGTVVWRVRWRQGGRNRSRVLGRKREAEAFDADITRRKRTGDLPQLARARSHWRSSAGSGGGFTRSRIFRGRRSRATRRSGTRTCFRGSVRCRFES